jgi:hypothetical protein
VSLAISIVCADSSQDHIIHVSPPSFLPAVGAEVFPKHFHSIEDRFLDNAIGPSSDVPVVVDNAQDGTSERYVPKPPCPISS